MVGITSINGFPLSMEQRFSKIKDAGFESLLLWWGNDETDSRPKRVALAHKYGLHIENAHAATDNLNALWIEGPEGNHTLSELQQEIIDCSELGIETLVVPLTNGNTPPTISSIGAFRIEQLIKLAEHLKVKLAFENVRKPEHLQYVLDSFHSPFVGLCYDSGHEHFWSPNIDWLNKYGARVFAVHLHDNNGDRDSHLLPFDGTIDWIKKAKQLAQSSYTGTITIESELRANAQYEKNGLEAFLSYAYEKGKKLAELIYQQYP